MDESRDSYGARLYRREEDQRSGQGGQRFQRRIGPREIHRTCYQAVMHRRTHGSVSDFLHGAAFVVWAFVVGSGVAFAQEGEEPWVVRSGAENGLSISARSSASNDVAVCVRYAVGRADDPEDSIGAAHLARHVLAGANPLHRQGIAMTVHQRGGASFSQQTASHTEFCSTARGEGLDALLLFEAQRMAYGTSWLNPRLFDRQRREALWTGSEPERTWFRTRRALFPAVREWQQEWAAALARRAVDLRHGLDDHFLSYDAARHFISANFRPGNAN